MGMREAEIKKLVEEQVRKTFKEYIKEGASAIDEASLIGYNPLEKIRGALFQWIAVPFNGASIICQLRCPNAVQIETCGDITNIIDEEKRKNKSYEPDEITQIRNYQEAICQLVLNQPTYDNVALLVGRDDFIISKKKKELEDLKKKFEEGKKDFSETEKEETASQISAIEHQIGYILPDDTMAFLTRWAMGNDISDIRKINREMFLRAASLAKAHGKAPSDYLSGVFTDFNRVEIDAYAANILDEHIKDQKAVGESSHKWFFGRNKGGKAFELPKRIG